MVPASSMMPTIKAPKSAPGAEPTPPRMAAAKTEMMRPAPIKGSMLASKPRKTPAPPARAPPPKVAAAITRSVGTPLTAARSGVSPGGAQAVVEREGDIGADRKIGADGEVRKAQEPPEEREGDGGEREDAARHEAVEDVLRDRRHPSRAVRD